MTPSCLIATSKTWPSTTVVPALFSRAGARVTALSPGPLGYSSYVSERLRCSGDPSRAATAVRELLTRRTFDWVVIGDDDLLSALFDAHADSDPQTWSPVDPSDRDAVALTLSKHAFVERAAGLGITIPESIFAATASETVLAAKRLGFPVVLKGDRGFGGSQVRVCHDLRALTLATCELLASNERVVVQRCIEGVRVSACVLYDRGIVAACKAYRAECCYPGPHSASTVHRYFQHDDVVAVAESLGRATGFHGMAGIDFIVDASGTPYALELNPRPTIGFGGTAANRAFFAPPLSRLLRGQPAGPTRAFDGRPETQAYFPAYLIYFARHLGEHDPSASRRLLACLREARVRDAGLAIWEMYRSVSDGIERRCADRNRAAMRRNGLNELTMVPALPLQDPERSVR